MCGISGVVRLDKEELDTKAFYTALSLMRHRGPDDEGTVFISTDTGRFEERGGPDTPSELHLFSLFIPTTFGANLGLGNRRALSFVAGHGSSLSYKRWIFHGSEIGARSLKTPVLQAVG